MQLTGLFGAKQDLNVRKMLTRMSGAARLREATFKDLKDDPSATLQSFLLVPITGLCYGVGLSAIPFLDTSLSLSEAILVVLLGLVSACIIAIIWSVTAYALVTRLFGRGIRYPSLARPFFFSWTPGLLFILLSLPNGFVSEIFRVGAAAWVAIASIFAVRYSGGLTVQQSMITFIMSILVLFLALLIVSSLFQLFFT